ncbi:hypothetical protein Mal15_36920 [Stieleria maiorica]|uniref:SGNH/GDSL hydrolase family protein n=1 Tax=Stieleria maiorica TaxID=2795974 RepID=A0A5B9MHV6_9BACT|nr:hypothetical protein [Stieleria maiorica]QEF99626.1 hypothetical protein Mal15_36920 [Stieleria maiorica]
MRNASDSPPSNAVKEFWLGATTPSLLAVTLAFFIPASLLLTALLLITPEFMVSENFRYLYDRRSNDTDNFVTHKVLSFVPPKGQAVYLFGSSSTREAIHTEKQLERAIAAHSDQRVNVYNFANAGASFWETFQVVDRLPKLTNGIVVIEVRPLHFCRGVDRLREVIESPRLGVTSPMIDSTARANGIQVPRRLGIYAWDNRRFFLARIPSIPKNLMDPIVVSQSRHLAAEQVDQVTWTDHIEKRTDLLASFQQNVADTSKFLKASIRRLKQNDNVQVVLLEATMSPRMKRHDIDRGFWPIYQNVIADVSNECDVMYWDINDSVPESGYLDWAHLRNLDAKSRFADALAKKVAEQLDATR